MEFEQLQHKLSALDKQLLEGFILDLYLHFPELADRIETLSLIKDPSALTKAIAKRIQSLKRGRRFIDYRFSFAFTQDLELIIGDIEGGLLEGSPEQAFALADKFLATADAVLNRVDDSGGAVADVYRAAILPAEQRGVCVACATSLWSMHVTTTTQLLIYFLSDPAP